jgi:hypothetical protein
VSAVAFSDTIKGTDFVKNATGNRKRFCKPESTNGVTTFSFDLHNNFLCSSKWAKLLP